MPVHHCSSLANVIEQRMLHTGEVPTNDCYEKVATLYVEMTAKKSFRGSCMSTILKKLKVKRWRCLVQGACHGQSYRVTP